MRMELPIAECLANSISLANRAAGETHLTVRLREHIYLFRHSHGGTGSESDHTPRLASRAASSAAEYASLSPGLCSSAYCL